MGRAFLITILFFSLNGFAQQWPEPTFSIYPNPASNWVMIELSQGTYDQLENPEIIITDLTGKVIHQTQLTRSTYLWETGKIENGVYLILVRSTDKLFTAQKVVVNR